MASGDGSQLVSVACVVEADYVAVEVARAM
jgi:hypothetical protein